MILRLFLKIWPALTPILIYLFWVLAIVPLINKFSKKDFIEAEFEEVNGVKKLKKKVSNFSLKNTNFLIVIYCSLILMIISFLFFAIRTPKIEDGKYIPAQSQDGKIISGKIIEITPESSPEKNH